MTDVLITINQEDYAFAQKHIHAKKVVYVPGMGIDTEFFRPKAQVRQEKRRELGYSDEDFLMLTVAEMTKNKNHATTLRAIALLKDQSEYARLHYLIVGRGEQWQNLQLLAKELGIDDHVHFLGYRTDAPELYQAADLFAFMSFREGLSVALMEALCSGMCAVCTRIRGNTDLIEDGVSGIFTENTPEALAENMLKLIRDPALRSRLQAGAAEAMKKYDAQKIHDQVKKIYLELMEGKEEEA